MTTDAFVVQPLFFPGGDIGSLAVHGTVNDLAVGGARPRYLTAAFILEEGLPLAELRRVIALHARAPASSARVRLVSRRHQGRRARQGRRHVHHHHGRRLWCRPGVELSANAARPGDVVIVSGTIGDHGIAVLAVREGIELETALQSDSAPLHGLW